MCTSSACCEPTEYQNKIQTIRSKLVFIYATKLIGVLGRGKGSSISSCCRPPCEHQVEPALPPAWWGFILIQRCLVKCWGPVSGRKEGEARTVFAPECCSLHPTSLHIMTGSGCMSENSGANTHPKEMQTARSWKRASVTKPVGLGCS